MAPFPMSPFPGGDDTQPNIRMTRQYNFGSANC